MSPSMLSKVMEAELGKEWEEGAAATRNSQSNLPLWSALLWQGLS